jgi:glycosyltransferase involved in cell wall biosynthesis
MRIGLVVKGGVDRGGRERVVPALLQLVARLARRHDVHVFALDQYPEPCTYPLLGATVHNLGMRPAPPGLGMARALPHLLAALRSTGPCDVLHGYMGVPAGFLAVVAARRLRVPAVVTFDGNELVALPEIGYGLGLTRRGRLLVALIARLAARVTVCTSYMARLARERDIAVEIVPLGIDPALAPAGHGPEDGPPWRLLHVGHLNRVKDQSTLLQALALIRLEVQPPLHLDVVGVDTLGGAVQAECAALGLEGHVTFHGLLPADAVWPYYRRAHLLLLSSRHEGAGVVALEAAACGVPTVGTAVGYVADWDEIGAARAVPVGDPRGLARGVLDLLRDGAARRRIAAAAGDLVRKQDAEWSARRFETLYETVAPTAAAG